MPHFLHVPMLHEYPGNHVCCENVSGAFRMLASLVVINSNCRPNNYIKTHAHITIAC